jgi:hypothetical protein
MLNNYEPFLGRPYRYAIANIDYHPDRDTGSAWGLTHEVDAWQFMGTDDARHVRIATTVPLRVATDGNRTMDATVAARIRSELLANANGAMDSDWRKYAEHLVFGGHGDAILRLGHEMDIRWYPWSIQNGNADAYIAAFRRARQVMKAVSPSFLVDYNVNGDHMQSYPGFPNRLHAAYPGDAHVDIIGVNLYNRQPWATSLANLNRVWDFARAHGKAFSVPEWGLWKNETGDDAQFIQNMRDWFVAHPVLYQGYFWNFPNSNFDATTINGANYAAPNAKARYKALFGA